MKEKIKTALLFILNPRLLFCIALAWLITNGWSYVCLAIGTIFRWNLMVAIASAYMAFLWFPGTPEKIITFIIAIFLLRKLFPKDEHTLRLLIEWREKLVKSHRERKNKKREKTSDTDEKTK